MKKLFQSLTAYGLVCLGHLAATGGVAIALTLIVLPTPRARGVLAQLYEVPTLWEMSTFAIALHFGIAACVWALAYIMFQLVRLRFEARTPKMPKTVRLSRGTVVTETLIIMPVFLLLTFGMAQLTLNNIAGILANVAAYQGARAAWVWQPEEDASDRRMNLEDGTTEQKCRIAVAFAMMPVAPGNFMKAPMLDSDFADKSRLLALGANIPLTGLVTDYIGSDLAELGAAGIGA